ncbi:MAG: TonB-dependent receptor [Bacteroidota bacterium]
MKFQLKTWLLLLGMVFCVAETWAQAIQVSGTVTNKSTGAPMEGASIQVKGTNVMATSSATGAFSISLPANSRTLKVTYVGMADQEFDVTGSGPVTIQMEDQAASMGEVVVVGYGTQRKSNITGSISTLKTKELVQSPVGDLSNALTGRVSGVITKQTTGEPGRDGAQIYIRGNATFGGGTMEPLFVVDGIVRQYRDFSQLDANEIESINVLKDASSAAIFGVKGANGVILVTTKRGKAGKLNASYSFNYGVNKVTRLPDNLGSYEYGTLYNEAKLNDNPNATPEFSNERLELFKSGTDPDAYPNTDWMGLVLGGSATRMQHNVSLSGGSEKVKYFTSLGYLDDKGLYSSLGYKRYNIRTNLDIQVTKTTRFSADISGRLENRSAPPTGTSSIFEHTMRNPPTQPAIFENGFLAAPGVYPNPLAFISKDAGYEKNSDNVILTNFQFVQDIPWVKGLSLKGVMAFDRSFSYNKRWSKWVPLYVKNTDGTYAANAPVLSSLSKSFGEGKSLELQGHVNYDRRFGRHNVSALVLFLQKESSNSGLYAARNSYTSSALEILNFGPALNETLNDNEDRYGLRSAAARINYDFDGKYLMQASLRRDQSENFAPAKRTGYFPAISLGWVASKEAFLANIKSLDYLKFKGSLGQLGSDRIPSRFGYYNRYNLVSNNYPFGGVLQNGLEPGAIANENLTWETATKTDVGFEARLWKGLFGIDFTWFKERREDILATKSLSVPFTFGGTLPSENIGIVENKGYELTLTHDFKITKDFSYFLRGNLTIAKNKIIEAAEAANVPENRKITGRPNNGYYGYKAIGIYRDQQDYANSPKLVAFSNSTGPGDIKYEDISGPAGKPDGIIDPYDITYLGGGPLPEISYGFMGGVNYKGFELNFLFQGATKVQQLLVQNAAWAFYNSGRVTGEWLDRWTPDRPDASLPRLSLISDRNNQQTSSFWVEDATFLRLKNAEIAYTIKPAVLTKIGASQVRVYANGQNLLTFTNIKNVDPENNNASGWYYPQQMTFNFGINVQF